VVDVTATGKGCGPQSDVCRELKTAGLLAIGPLGLMAGGTEDHFTDSRELYVLVEGDEWAHVEALEPDAGYWARRSAQLVNWRARGRESTSVLRCHACRSETAPIALRRTLAARRFRASRLQSRLTRLPYLVSVWPEGDDVDAEVERLESLMKAQAEAPAGGESMAPCPFMLSLTGLKVDEVGGPLDVPARAAIAWFGSTIRADRAE
jgi:hypothetical protein